MCGVYCGYATEDIVQCYYVVLEVIVVKTTVDIVEWYCVVCGGYCGYSNSRYSAKVLCCVGVYCGYNNSRYIAMVLYCVWSLLWLQEE